VLKWAVIFFIISLVAGFFGILVFGVMPGMLVFWPCAPSFTQ
jgi:uncharacterized membrane protein YtjA (UPF0391 family)